MLDTSYLILGLDGLAKRTGKIISVTGTLRPPSSLLITCVMRTTSMKIHRI
jgi:hypothetical protein